MLGLAHPADTKGPATGPGRHRDRRSAAAPLALGLTVAALLTALGGAAAFLPGDVLGTTGARSAGDPSDATTAASGSGTGTGDTGSGGTGTAGTGTAGTGPGGAGPGGSGPGSAGPGGGGIGPGGVPVAGPTTGSGLPDAATVTRPRPAGPASPPAGGDTARQSGTGAPGGAPARSAAPRGTATDARGTSAGTAARTTATDDDGFAALEDEVVTLTNVERRRNGCAELTPNTALRTAIRLHVQEVARHDGLYLSHVSDDGRTFAQRAREQGYPDPGAENVARGQRTPADVVQGWMASSGHRANIVNCDLRSLGVGVARGDGSLVWGQLFGRS